MKKAYIKTIGTCISSVMLGAAGLSAQAGTLSIGHTTWVGYGTLYLAQAKGFFEEGGLTVELPTIEEASSYMAAQAAGHLDGSASTIDEILKYRSDESCFKAVVALDDSHGGDGIVVEDGIDSLEDLKGQTVAVNEGAVSQFWLSYLLKKSGMSLDDITPQNMTADDAAAAFIAGRVPIAVTWEPHLSLVRSHDRGKVLVDSSSTPGVIVDVVSLRCDVIEQQPGDVQALVNGLYKAVEYLGEHPKESYELMAKGVGGYLEDPKALEEAAQGVRFFGLKDNERLIGTSENPGTISEVIDIARQTWNEVNDSDLTVNYSDLIDSSFISQP